MSDNLMEEISEYIESLIDRFYEDHGYIRPSSYLWNSGEWLVMEAPKNRVDQIYIIADLLWAGFEVKTGWSATSIKGVHDRYIFYKTKQND